MTVLEVLDSDNFLEEHVLAISSLYAIAREPRKQTVMIQKLKDHRVSGLLLFNVGRVIDKVADEVIKTCDLIGFPLIVMPIEISYFETLFAIIDCLLKQQNKRLKEYVNNYDNLIQEVINARSHDGLMRAFHKIIKKPVLFCNVNSNQIYKSPDNIDDQLIKDVLNEINTLKEEVYKKKTIHTVKRRVQKLPVLFSPVVQNDTIFGCLVILECEELNSSEEVILRQVRNLICITEINNMRVKEYREKIREEYIKDLLLGDDKTEEQLINEGKSLNIDAGKIKQIISFLVTKQSHETNDEKNWNSLQMTDSLNLIYDHICRKLESFFPTSYIEKIENHLVLMYCPQRELKKNMGFLEILSENMIENVHTEFNVYLSVGASKEVSNVEEIRKAYTQSCYAIQYYRRIFGKNGFCRYNQISLLDHVFRNLDSDSVQASFNAFFEPIINFDKESNSCLLQSFFTLLECDLNAAEASRRMFVHRNTMLQRKKKIKSLYSYDIYSEENIKLAKFIFQVASIFKIC